MNRPQRVAQVFVELADTLTDSFDVVDFTQMLAEHAVAVLGADASGVMLADQRGDLRLMAATLEQARSLELFELQIDEGPCLDCYATGEAVTHVNLSQSDAQWPRFTPVARDLGFRSTHAIPMKLRDQVIGALNLFTERSDDLSEEDLAIARAMADVATIGLLQERTLAQRDVLTQQLQTALDSRVVIEQAKGSIAAVAQISVNDAFARLRAHARSSGLPLAAVASAVVNGSIDAKSLPRGQKGSAR